MSYIQKRLRLNQSASIRGYVNFVAKVARGLLACELFIEFARGNNKFARFQISLLLINIMI